MTDKLFDDFVRDKLKNHPSAVPDGLWEKIVREKDRERPAAYWWKNYTGLLISAGIAALMGGAYLFTKLNSNDHTATLKTSIVTSRQAGNQLPHDGNEGHNATVPAAAPVAEAAKPGIGTSTSSETSLPAASRENGAPGHQVSAESGSILPKPGTYVAPIVNTAGGKPGTTGNITAAGSRKNTSSLLAPDKGDKNTALPLLNSTTGISPITPGTAVPLDENTVAADLEARRMSLTTQRFLNTVFPGNGHLGPVDNKGIILLSDCPSVRGYQRNDWYLEIYGSPDFNSKSVSSAGISNAYIQKKDSSETMTTGFTVGARISRNLGDHILLRSGLQYSQLNEQFSNRTESERNVTTVIVARTIIRPQGDTTISDTTTVIQIGYRVRKASNTYRNLEIPLIAGYEFGGKEDRWHLAVNGGVIINAASWYSGETLDTAYNVVPIDSKGSTVIYKHSVGLSLYGSVSAAYGVAKNLEVFAEPYARFGVSSTKSDVGFTQRFNGAGLTVGIRLKLNGKGSGFKH